MSPLEFCGLFVIWLLATLFIGTLTWFEFRRVRFNFNVFFSLLFLLTFFFGFPLQRRRCAARYPDADAAGGGLLLWHLLCDL
jgi:hypothetical protein